MKILSRPVSAFLILVLLVVLVSVVIAVIKERGQSTTKSVDSDRVEWVGIPGTSVVLKPPKGLAAEPLVAFNMARKDALTFIVRKDDKGQAVTELRIGPSEFVGFSTSGAVCANDGSCDLYKTYEVKNSTEGKIGIYKHCCALGDPNQYEFKGQVLFGGYSFGPGQPLAAAVLVDSKDESILDDFINSIRSVRY